MKLAPRRPWRSNKPTRMRDPETGGEKDSKQARHDLIPPSVLDELARVYGEGAAKYSDYNYLQGYGWKWSEAALGRHLQAWRSGESYDPDTGLHHLAAVMFHAGTLMTYEWFDIGTDTRIEPKLRDGTLTQEEQ